jgi:hypothetical protein
LSTFGILWIKKGGSALILSRETDYALRILQSLLDGERKSVGDISTEEFTSYHKACIALRRMPVSSVTTLKNKQQTK